MAERRLEGLTIAVTRPEAQSGPLAEALERLGAHALVLPLVEIVPPADPAPLEATLAGLPSYDWLVLTSANAVSAVRDRARAAGLVRVAVVGSATATAARAAGLEPSFVPERFAGEEIAAGLEPLRGRRVLLPQADVADPALATELRERGAHVDAPVAYRTVVVTRSPAELAELRSADSVVLASGSAARSLAAQGGPGRALVACIGPKTAAAAREVGFSVGVVADEASADGVVRALLAHFGETA